MAVLRHFNTRFVRLVAVLNILVLSGLAARAEVRSVLNFNSDWKFCKADPTNAFTPQFNDTGWATVSAPHSFNDVDTFDHFALPGMRALIFDS